MNTLLISTFKAKCIEVLNGVHDGGEPVVITRRGKPLARIVSASAPAATARKLAATPGEMTIVGDVVHGDLDQDWESLK